MGEVSFSEKGCWDHKEFGLELCACGSGRSDSSNWNFVVFANKLNRLSFILGLTTNPPFLLTESTHLESQTRKLRWKTAHFFFHELTTVHHPNSSETKLFVMVGTSFLFFFPVSFLFLGFLLLLFLPLPSYHSLHSPFLLFFFLVFILVCTKLLFQLQRKTLGSPRYNFSSPMCTTLMLK